VGLINEFLLKILMEKLGEIIRSVCISKRVFMFTQSLIQTGHMPSKKWSGQNLTGRTAGSGPVNTVNGTHKDTTSDTTELTNSLPCILFSPNHFLEVDWVQLKLVAEDFYRGIGLTRFELKRDGNRRV